MQTKKVEPHTSSLGLNANYAAILVFAVTIAVSWIPFVKYFSWAVPLVFFYIEKNSDFVRYNAVSAFVLYIVEAIIYFIFNVVISGVISAMFFTNPFAYAGNWGALAAVSGIVFVISILFLIITIFCIYNAYAYNEFRIPVLGALADKLRPLFYKAVKTQPTVQNSTETKE